MPSFGLFLSEFPDEPYLTKTTMMGLSESDGEDLAILHVA